jgi:hypothetical protein
LKFCKVIKDFKNIKCRKDFFDKDIKGAV